MNANDLPVWEWYPTINVGPIEYGMSIGEVQRLFPQAPVTDKIPHPLHGEQYVDRYESFSVFYNAKGEAEKVSIMPSSTAPRVQHCVWKEEHDLIHTPFEDLRDFLFKKREYWTIEDDGWIIRSSLHDIEVYGPNWWSMKDGVKVSTYPGAYATAVVFYAPGLILDLLEYRRRTEFKILEALMEEDLE